MLDSLLLACCLAVPGPVASAAPAPSPPLATAPARADEPTIQPQEIKAADGTKCKASFYVPKGDERAPAALLIHKAGGDRSQLTELAGQMWKAGYAVLTIDLRGHGESIVKPEDAYSALEDDDDRATAWAFATRDVEAAARWLRANRRVHSSNFSMVGVDEGCALAVRHAANDENVRSVTLISPRAEVLGFDLVEDLQDLEGVPTFFIAPKERLGQIEELAEKIHTNLGCEPFITVAAVRVKAPAKLLDDRKLASAITKPLKSISFPTRGSRRR